MKQKTFVIHNAEIIKTLVAFLETWPKDPPFQVVVKEYKKDRSLQQNSLMWLWITVISNELGLTKEDIHEDLKKRLLVPIYERDDSDYCRMINTLRKLFQDGFKAESKELHRQVVKLTSTTNATVKQFAEYLTEIERDMIGKGIILPHKEDLYYDSLGIKPDN